jgi:hypothetical protein
MTGISIAVLMYLASPALAEKTTDLPVVADRLSLETVMQRNDIDQTDAQVVTTNSRVDMRLLYDRVHGYTPIEGPRVTETSLLTLGPHDLVKTEAFEQTRSGMSCTSVKSTSSDQEPGSLKLRLYDRSSAPTRDGTLAELLISQTGHDDTVATWLAPGEQVTVVEVQGRGDRVGRIELERKTRTLVVLRKSQATRACVDGK